MKATLHRAFDEVVNALQSLEEVIDCGFDRILTSGKKETAVEGASLILELILLSKKRISIMPGGGFRSENISQLKKTGAVEFHSSALVANRMTVDENEIRQMKNLLSQ